MFFGKLTRSFPCKNRLVTLQSRLRCSSSAASRSNINVNIDVERKEGMDFSNYSISFAKKSNLELYRAYLVYSVCGVRKIVENSGPLLRLSYTILGERITNWALRSTFFGHFCAGEDGNAIQPTIQKLKTNGIGAILDYAAEADVPADKKTQLDDVPRASLSARTYDYIDESYCDANAAIFVKAIEAAAENDGDKGFACAKLTALGRPALLEHVSMLLSELRCLFYDIAHSRDPSSHNTGTLEPPLTETKMSFKSFIGHLHQAKIPIKQEEAEAIFKKMDIDKNGHIDYYEWTTFIDPITLSMGELNHYRTTSKLDESQIHQMQNLVQRLENLAVTATKYNVKLLVDAEQTYMQPAIDHLVINLQRKYNRKAPIIFHTVQCYLKDSMQRLNIDLTRCRHEGWIFACKIVRGAYMIQERKRALDMNYPDPIHNTIQDTHTNYNGAIKLLLQNNTISEFMVASHNQQSISYATQLMNEMSIPKNSGVYFGQLFGMADNISYALGAYSYQVYKYVPYGPIKEVVPYLIRRAEENATLLSNVTVEKAMIAKELRLRRSR